MWRFFVALMHIVHRFERLLGSGKLRGGQPLARLRAIINASRVCSLARKKHQSMASHAADLPTGRMKRQHEDGNGATAPGQGIFVPSQPQFL